MELEAQLVHSQHAAAELQAVRDRVAELETLLAHLQRTSVKLETSLQASRNSKQATFHELNGALAQKRALEEQLKKCQDALQAMQAAAAKKVSSLEALPYCWCCCQLSMDVLRCSKG